MNQSNYSTKNIFMLISELELAVNTSKLTRIERNKIVLRLLKIQHELMN